MILSVKKRRLEPGRLSGEITDVERQSKQVNWKPIAGCHSKAQQCQYTDQAYYLIKTNAHNRNLTFCSFSVLLAIKIF